MQSKRREITLLALRVALAAALLAFVGFSLVTAALPRPVAPTRTPGIVVGIPGGAVVEPSRTASPAALTPRPSSTPPAATLPPTPVPPTPAPTAVAQPSTPPAQPPTPAPTPVITPATPVPTPIVVAAIDPPEAAVAAFYHDAVVGDFDAAYALWDDRMRSTYPREANLDERFDQTADITFSALYTVERSDTTAVVQANFTETYDSGSSRVFIGYWRLVLVDGRWLLDEPHY